MDRVEKWYLFWFCIGFIAGCVMTKVVGWIL